VCIINFSVLVPGPSCTHLFQQMGSKAIKVEARAGDPLRNMNATVFSL
jgi:crotonobetainyl-CoA:carnitine CoA-transferase CaiB-like acyl-CoA transferase